MFIKNLLYLSGAEIVSKVATIAAIAYLARVVGTTGFGYVELAAAVMLCASLVVDQGFGPYGAREIAKTPERTAQLASEIVTARAILALVAYALVVAYAFLLNDSATLVQLLLLYGLSLLIMPLLMQWVFQGHSKMQTVGIMQLIRQLAFAALIFAFLRDESDLWIAALAELAGVACSVLYGLWMYRHQLQGRLRLPATITANLVREGVPIGLSQTFWVVRMFGATILVGAFATAHDVGLFSSAMRILVALHAFIWLYFFNLLPALSIAWKGNDGSFAHIVAISLHAVAWVVALITLIWALIAPTVMGVIYGANFVAAASTLQWLAGVFLAAALSGHYRFGLIAAGHQKVEMFVQLCGTVAALFLVPLGYRNAGPAGAAMGLAVAEMITWWVAWWRASHLLGLKGHAQLLLLPALATMITVGVLWITQDWSLAIRVILATLLLVSQALIFDASLRKHLQRGVIASTHSVDPVH